MKHNIRHTYPALVVAGTLVASLALAGDKSDSQKLDPKMEEMRDPAKENFKTMEITYSRK